VIAESDDDLSDLSIPSEEASSKPISPQEALNSAVDPPQSSDCEAEAPSPSREDNASPTKRSQSSSASSSSSNKRPQNQTYPLYPSISQLLHEKGLPSSEADKIPASGPKGRLLKGDVLAYLGTINSSYSLEQSARITKLGHLDLSNVKAAPPRKEPEPKKYMPPEPEMDSEIAVPISLDAVLSVQKRLEATLGVTLPLSNFIARASELANDELPRSTASAPTADELFDDVLGLTDIGASKTSRGQYMPQVTVLPPVDFTMSKPTTSRHPNIYDLLTGSKSLVGASLSLTEPMKNATRNPKPIDSSSVFSVSVAKGEEKVARVFLERMKTILQVEPGRLIL